MTERLGIEIDYCPKCRGVWLDRGELDKIVERSAAELASAARAPSPQGAMAAPAAEGYGHGGHRPYRDDRHHGGHYRKSFWKELFD
jgi:Zn-finger nucleic acid-binding protein